MAFAQMLDVYRLPVSIFHWQSVREIRRGLVINAGQQGKVVGSLQKMKIIRDSSFGDFLWEVLD